MVVVIGGFFTLPSIYAATQGSWVGPVAGLIWTFCLLGALVAALTFLVTFAMDGFNMARDAELDEGPVDLGEHRRVRTVSVPHRPIERRAS
jgi:hypothetical protein